MNVDDKHHITMFPVEVLIFKILQLCATLTSNIVFGVSPPESKSNVFFVDSPRCSSVQQPPTEKSIVKEAEIPISPLTELSINHNALQPQDMLRFQ